MVELHVLLGFLGSGKTSVMRTILENTSRFEKIAVIVGDFAERNYDGGRLEAMGFPVHSISGQGHKGQLAAYLDALRTHVQSGDYTRIFLETSGAIQAQALAADLQRDDLLRTSIRFGACTTVVSMGDVDRLMEHYPEHLLAQMRLADVVLLNKMDKLPVPERRRVRDQIQALVPEAHVQPTYMGQARRGLLVATPDPGPSRLLQNIDAPLPAEPFETLVYHSDARCADRVRFGNVLLNLPQQIARFKGVLQCFDRARALNGLPGQLDWDNHEVEGPTWIALIGKDLEAQRDTIFAALDEAAGL